MPQFAFPGLKPGDRWCLCAARWQEAFEVGLAPKGVLRATHARTLEVIDFADLKAHAMSSPSSKRLAYRASARRDNGSAPPAQDDPSGFPNSDFSSSNGSSLAAGSAVGSGASDGSPPNSASSSPRAREVTSPSPE